jgi:hypothetical protein
MSPEIIISLLYITMIRDNTIIKNQIGYIESEAKQRTILSKYYKFIKKYMIK